MPDLCIFFFLVNHMWTCDAYIPKLSLNPFYSFITISPTSQQTVARANESLLDYGIKPSCWPLNPNLSVRLWYPSQPPEL